MRDHYIEIYHYPSEPRLRYRLVHRGSGFDVDSCTADTLVVMRVKALSKADAIARIMLGKGRAVVGSLTGHYGV